MTRMPQRPILSTMMLSAFALATALMVMGPEQGLAFANKNGIAALFLTRNGDQVVESESSAMRRINAAKHSSE